VKIRVSDSYGYDHAAAGVDVAIADYRDFFVDKPTG
jgi:hypothetical protein